MTKKQSNFIDKFNERIQIIGKEGVLGIIQENHIPIKPIPFEKMPPKYRKSLSMKDISNNDMIDKEQDTNNNTIKDKAFFRANPRIYKRYAHPKDSSFISESVNLYVRPADNLQNVIDHGYTPYSIKDYNKLPKEIKLGKLGPDFGKDWKKRKIKINKMKEYGNHIMDVGHGLFFRNIVSPEEIRKKEQKQKIINGRIRKIKEYSKSINERDKYDIEFFKHETDQAILKRNKQKYIENQKLYFLRLEKLKAKLLN